jgi:hypothetical protein
MATAMPARSEKIRALAAEIRRHAMVAAIKRRALDPAPVLDSPYDQKLDRSRPTSSHQREEDRASFSSSRQNTPRHGPLAECPLLGRTGNAGLVGMTRMSLSGHETSTFWLLRYKAKCCHSSRPAGIMAEKLCSTLVLVAVTENRAPESGWLNQSCHIV